MAFTERSDRRTSRFEGTCILFDSKMLIETWSLENRGFQLRISLSSLIPNNNYKPVITIHLSVGQGRSRQRTLVLSVGPHS